MDYIMPPITDWLDAFDGRTKNVEKIMDEKMRNSHLLQAKDIGWVTGSKVPKE